MSGQRPATYVEAEELAIESLHRYRDETGESLIDESFADPAPDLIAIVGIVLRSLGYDPDEHREEIEAEERRGRFEVVDGGEG